MFSTSFLTQWEINNDKLQSSRWLAVALLSQRREQTEWWKQTKYRGSKWWTGLRDTLCMSLIWCKTLNFLDNWNRIIYWRASVIFCSIHQNVPCGDYINVAHLQHHHKKEGFTLELQFLWNRLILMFWWLNARITCVLSPGHGYHLGDI